MSRRVLLVCYYFPPLGLGGVGRPLNLFKRLPGHGWQCDVLTVKPVVYRAYEPELLRGLDPSRIYRSGSYDPQRMLYLLGLRKVKASTISQAKPVSEKFFPDSKVGWTGPAIRLGSRLCRQNHYDAIISTSPPISSHLIGKELARRFQLPWVADFRDFWTIYKAEEVYGDERRRLKARMLLDGIKVGAAAVTAVNPSIVEYLGAGETITNGYDPALAERWRTPPSKEVFTVGLLGHQHDTREIEPLLQLLELVKKRDPEHPGRIRLLQVGQIDVDWFRDLLRVHRLDVQVELHRQQTRADTIRILSQAHVFFLGISDKEGPGFLPGRTFELIASGRPLFVYARPDSEIARVVEPCGNACRFHADSYERAVDSFLSQIQAFDSGSYHYTPLSDYARQFSGDKLAERFAQLLDRLI